MQEKCIKPKKKSDLGTLVKKISISTTFIQSRLNIYFRVGSRRPRLQKAKNAKDQKPVKAKMEKAQNSRRPKKLKAKTGLEIFLNFLKYLK
jgi:hypothetical protein